MKLWYVYIILCSDGTLYTGITTDPDRRVDEHNRGGAAKYTASRRPVELKYLETARNRSDASKRELAIKKMSRTEKFTLINKTKY
jgi:putative endonuclease